MKILFHLNCLAQGGAERVVSTLSNAFAADGIEVVVATEWIDKDEFVLDERVRRLVVGPTEADMKKSRVHKALVRFKYLKDCVRKENPDVVIAFDHKASYRALVSCRHIHVPVVLSVRTDPNDRYTHSYDKVLIPLLYPRADGCVFQTEGQREFFPKYLQRKSEIIYNPLNDKYLGVRRTAAPAKTVVTHGRISKPKNQAMLICAFAKVHEKHPDYDLKIYGPDAHDGTWEKLVNLIDELEAKDYVHLMGGSDELEKQIPECEIYAFSSDYEGLPNSILEAMAMGMPVISTDCPCGGPRTVIEDGVNGLLISVGDETAMAEKICSLIEDKEYAAKLGEKASDITEKVNLRAIVDEWKAYIDTVISKYRN